MHIQKFPCTNQCQAKGMNQYEKALFLGFAMVWIPTFALYHFIVFRVNRQLPPDRKIQHSTWGQWNRIATEYKGLYPRSLLYELMLSGAIVVLILAFAIAGLRVWEYVKVG